MSDSTPKIRDLTQADPEAIDAVIEFLEARMKPIVLDSLGSVKNLMKDEFCLQAAYDAGRASVVGDLRQVRSKMEG